MAKKYKTVISADYTIFVSDDDTEQDAEDLARMQFEEELQEALKHHGGVKGGIWELFEVNTEEIESSSS